MFAEIIDVASFKSIFNKMEIAFKDVVFECDSEGIRFTTLDGGKTTFMNVELTEDYFWEYECKEPDKFSVELSELRKVLKSVKDKLIIETTSEEVILRSDSKKFTLYQLTIDYSETMTPPKIPYAYSVTLPFDWIKETAKDMKTFSNDFEIVTMKDKFLLRSMGQIGAFENHYDTAKVLEETSAKFALDKLDLCLASDKVSEAIKIYGRTDSPVCLELENDGILVSYLIAPKLEMV